MVVSPREEISSSSEEEEEAESVIFDKIWIGIVTICTAILVESENESCKILHKMCPIFIQ